METLEKELKKLIADTLKADEIKVSKHRININDKYLGQVKIIIKRPTDNGPTEIVTINIIQTIMDGDIHVRTVWTQYHFLYCIATNDWYLFLTKDIDDDTTTFDGDGITNEMKTQFEDDISVDAIILLILKRELKLMNEDREIQIQGEKDLEEEDKKQHERYDS